MEKKGEAKRVYWTIFFGLLWLLGLGLWLFFYAENYSLVQNIAVFLISIVLVGAVAVVIWVPWSIKNE